ncbi:(d)CMP kinase [Cellvibrio mixtus]|uniref:(d)CMP kinase n=1 Tax=Cellvibrio mixtus TaxID=39650 RepID=UPI0005867BEC|nr:(d)CMP kinase [Cellvibrio mixtus]
MSNNKPMVVTIDGPSGSGKGTLSQMLAKHLGYHLLDSGALYRLVALAAMKRSIDLTNEVLVAAIAQNLNVEFSVKGESMLVLLDGEDVTDAIRQEVVSMGASKVAAHPAVRAALLDRQRAFARAPGLIADGRDMGTAVFPSAPTKIFLTASAEARAERRFKQLQAKGEVIDMAKLVADIRERDERDSKRAVSPLVPAADATIIDSTNIGIADVFARMLALIKQN